MVALSSYLNLKPFQGHYRQKAQESFPVGCRTLRNLHSASLDIQGRIPATNTPGQFPMGAQVRQKQGSGRSSRMEPNSQ